MVAGMNQEAPFTVASFSDTPFQIYDFPKQGNTFSFVSDELSEGGYSSEEAAATAMIDSIKRYVEEELHGTNRQDAILFWRVKPVIDIVRDFETGQASYRFYTRLKVLPERNMLPVGEAEEELNESGISV